MSPIDPKKVISSVRLSYYHRERNNELPHFAYTAFNENWLLLEKLFQYQESLGVDGYDQDENGIVWSINNNWFTSQQIERMLALKAFS